MSPIDLKNYPPDWEERRQRILIRADNCCEMCGLEDGQTVYSVPFRIKCDDGKYRVRRIWFSNADDAFREARNDAEVKAVTVVLTTAHLDHDEDNWEVEDQRLIAACQACHLRYDAEEKRKRKNNET